MEVCPTDVATKLIAWGQPLQRDVSRALTAHAQQ